MAETEIMICYDDIPPSCAECILTTDYWYEMDCPCGKQDELLHDDDRRDDCPLNKFFPQRKENDK